MYEAEIDYYKKVAQAVTESKYDGPFGLKELSEAREHWEKLQEQLKEEQKTGRYDEERLKKNLWERVCTTTIATVHRSVNCPFHLESERIELIGDLAAEDSKWEGAVQRWVYSCFKVDEREAAKNLGGCIGVWAKNEDKWSRYAHCPTFDVEYKRALLDILDLEKKQENKDRREKRRWGKNERRGSDVRSRHSLL